MSVPTATCTVNGTERDAAIPTRLRSLWGKSLSRSRRPTAWPRPKPFFAPQAMAAFKKFGGFPGHAELAAAQDLIHVLRGPSHHGHFASWMMPARSWPPR